MKVKEELKEVIIALGVSLEIKVQKSLNGLKTLGILAHGTVVNGISPIWLILLSQDLSHSHVQIASILLKQRLHSDVELFMTLHSVSIVEHG